MYGIPRFSRVLSSACLGLTALESPSVRMRLSTTASGGRLFGGSSPLVFHSTSNGGVSTSFRVLPIDAVPEASLSSGMFMPCIALLLISHSHRYSRCLALCARPAFPTHSVWSTGCAPLTLPLSCLLVIIRRQKFPFRKSVSSILLAGICFKR